MLLCSCGVGACVLGRENGTASVFDLKILTYRPKSLKICEQGELRIENWGGSRQLGTRANKRRKLYALLNVLTSPNKIQPNCRTKHSQIAERKS